MNGTFPKKIIHKVKNAQPKSQYMSKVVACKPFM